MAYTKIFRTMSEINEEVEKIHSYTGDTAIGLLTESTIYAFCDWLCGKTDLPLSSAVSLASFATKAMEKGVPLDDVAEFVGSKLDVLIKEDMEKKLKN